MDGSNWKTTPLPDDDDDVRNSTTIKCNSDALTITAIGPMRANDAVHHTKTSSSAVTDRSSSSSSSSSAPSSLHHHYHHQRNVVPSHRRNSSSSSGAKEEEEDVEEDDETSMNFFSDDREFDFLKAPLLPRSSSLKSRKTPPGTPTRRKSVRFADALGLDLELVRHILNPDDPPHVPPTACTRFLDPTDDEERPLTAVVSSSSYWRLCFPHPMAAAAAATAMGDRRGLLNRRKVSLESCTIHNSNRQIHGVVRVANVAYEKDVRVRYTLNGWLTSADVKATYIEHSNDLITDRFSFQLTIPEQLVAHSRLEFAVSFSAANQTFWDNNFNRNYALECVDYQTF